MKKGSDYQTHTETQKQVFLSLEAEAVAQSNDESAHRLFSLSLFSFPPFSLSASTCLSTESQKSMLTITFAGNESNRNEIEKRKSSKPKTATAKRRGE